MQRINARKITSALFIGAILMSFFGMSAYFIVVSLRPSAEARANEVLKNACAKTSALKHYTLGVQWRITSLSTEALLPVKRAIATPQVPVVADVNNNYVTHVAGNDYYALVEGWGSEVPVGIESSRLEVMRVDGVTYVNDATTGEDQWLVEDETNGMPGTPSSYGTRLQENWKSRLCPLSVEKAKEASECGSYMHPLETICEGESQEVEWAVFERGPTTHVLIAIERDRKRDRRLAGTYSNLVDELQVYSFEFWIDSSGYIVERRYTNRLMREGHLVAVIEDQVITIARSDPVKLEPPI